MSRRRFLFRCLGISTVLGAEAIRPQASISSILVNSQQREEEERASALPCQVSFSSDFPEPKFAVGEEVVAPWENEEGMHYSRAIIIGLMHDPYGYEVNGWWYLPRWIDNPQCPWMNNRDDSHFWHESYLKPVSNT